MVEVVQRLVNDDPAFAAGMGGFIEAEVSIVRILMEVDQRHAISAGQALKFIIVGLLGLRRNTVRAYTACR